MIPISMGHACIPENKSTASRDRIQHGDHILHGWAAGGYASLSGVCGGPVMELVLKINHSGLKGGFCA